MSALVAERQSSSPAVSRPVPALRIAVIIVHYKTPAMLLDCLRSLAPELTPVDNASVRPLEASPASSPPPVRPDHLFIVDNASGAPHLAELSMLHHNPAVTFIESPQNLGFAGANNLAIERVRQAGDAEFYLLLNPDTLVRPGALGTLLEFLSSHPQAASVGPRLEDPDGTPQQSAFNFPRPFSEFLRGASVGPLSRFFRGAQVYGPIHSQATPTHWLAGACVLLRRDVLEKTGSLDDGFFLYFEEVDFFRRARRQGLQAWYEPAAHVVHLVGSSSGIVVTQQQKRLPPYWFESRHRYFRKHFGYLGMLAADACWFTGHLLDRLRKLITGTSHAAVAACETRDLLHHSLRQFFHPFAHGGKR